MHKKYLPLLVLCGVVLAAFFRLFLLNAMPGGLFPDEAANGLDINVMEQGQLQPFYERGNGREALFFYLIWGLVKFFGRTPFAHHLASALVGITATLVCYLVTKKIFRFYASPATNAAEIADTDQPSHAVDKSTLIALLSFFLMAASSWHTVLSRTAFRANLIPLFTGLTFWALFSVGQAKTRVRAYAWSAIAGLSFGLGFYTYIAYRIMVPLVAILIFWPFLANVKLNGLRNTVRSYLPLTLLAVLSACIVLTPLGHYFYTHPDAFIGRSGQVSVFNHELNKGDLVGTILEVGRLSMLGYFTAGDLNWRHNISGYPFLSPLVSPFFALGLLLVLYGAIRYTFGPRKNVRFLPHFVLTGWFFSFLVPVITTAEGIPHGLRSIGTIPAVFIIAAFGLYETGHFVVRAIQNHPQPNRTLERWLQKGLVALVFCYLLAIPMETYALYFGVAGQSPEYFYAFRSDLTAVSKYLNAQGNRNSTYLVLDKFSVQTVDYLTTKEGKSSCDRDPNYRPAGCVDNPNNKPYMQVDPEDSWLADYDVKNGHRVYEQGLHPGMEVVFAQSSIFDIPKFKLFHQNAKLVYEERNKFQQAVVAVYRITN